MIEEDDFVPQYVQDNVPEYAKDNFLTLYAKGNTPEYAKDNLPQHANDRSFSSPGDCYMCASWRRPCTQARRVDAPE